MKIKKINKINRLNLILNKIKKIIIYKIKLSFNNKIKILIIKFNKVKMIL